MPSSVGRVWQHMADTEPLLASVVQTSTYLGRRWSSCARSRSRLDHVGPSSASVCLCWAAFCEHSPGIDLPDLAKACQRSARLGQTWWNSGLGFFAIICLRTRAATLAGVRDGKRPASRHLSGDWVQRGGRQACGSRRTADSREPAARCGAGRVARGQLGSGARRQIARCALCAMGGAPHTHSTAGAWGRSATCGGRSCVTADGVRSALDSAKLASPKFGVGFDEFGGGPDQT